MVDTGANSQSKRSLLRICAAGTLALALAAVAGVNAQQGPVPAPIAGRNVNINGGPAEVSGEPGSLRFTGDFNNKMQNEGACAANPLKPSNILCAYNNYSQVLEVPGLDPAGITRDATIGVAQSKDFGGHWVSEFLLGASWVDTRTKFPNGLDSALAPYNFHAGADAVVVATPGGLAHVSAIFFKGTDSTGASTGSVAVTTFIDPLNDDASPTPFVYAFQSIPMLGSDQNGGKFIDKPWMAAGESKVGTCSIPLKPGVTKTVDAYPLYLSWAVFTGLTPTDDTTNIYFSRSLDCGQTWSNPLQLTSNGISQGVAIAVQPATNNIDLVWRRFADPAQPLVSPNTDAIVWTRSTNGGQNFRTPNPIAEICPFTQGTSQTTFRINTFPTIAAGPRDTYVAWSDRRDPATNLCTGNALIRWSFYNTGNWSDPAIIENPMTMDPPDPGTLAQQDGHHQIQPALAYNNGTLGATWYDFRNDRATKSGAPFGESNQISEAGLSTRHTVDVRGALATINSMTGLPTFGPSAEISRYLRGVRAAGGAEVQLQYNRPNMRMFRLAMDNSTNPPTRPPGYGVPFFSDYLHLTPLGQVGSSPTFFASWTDSRDAVNGAVATSDSATLPARYTPPLVAAVCEPAKTKTLDMNLYGAVVTKGGLLAYSPSGSRPLGMYDAEGLPIPRTFVVVVRNTSMDPKSVRLVVRTPVGGTAQFVPDLTQDLLEIAIPRISSISRTVEVSPIGPGTLAANETIIVDVYEPASAALPTHTVFMNTDPYPIELENPSGDPDLDPNTTEVHTPVIDGDIIVSAPEIDSPEIDSPEIDSPEIDSPEIDSPEIDSRALSPEIDSPEIDSPEIDSPEIDSPEIDSAGIKDVSFVVQNDGNQWTSFRTRALAAAIDPALYHIQLLIWTQYNTKNVGCGPSFAATNQVAVNINDADVTTPVVPSSSVQNATVAVGPGEKYIVTLRIRPRTTTPVPETVGNNIGLVVTAEANNTGASAAPTLVLPTPLPWNVVANSAAGANGALFPGGIYQVTTNGTVDCTPGPTATFAPGATTVSCIATNLEGNNTVTGTFTVLVTAAATTTTVTAADAIYDGLPYDGATATVTGPGDLNDPLLITYTGINGTIYGPSSDAPIAAGSYTAAATFAGSGSYLGSTGSATFTITPAGSTTVVSCPASVTYTGAALEVCTATVTGAGLNQAVTPVTYSNNTNVGTAGATAIYAGDANHTGSTGSGSFTITPAGSTTVVSCPLSVTYTGAAQTPCTVTVQGAGGLSLTLQPTYANNVNAGTATASYTFVGDVNHSGSSDSETFTIAPASSTTTFGTAPAAMYPGDFTVNASNTSGGAIAYSRVSGPCDLISGATFRSSGAGTCVVEATTAATSNYLSSSAQQSVTITTPIFQGLLSPWKPGVTSKVGTTFQITWRYTNAAGQPINSGPLPASASLLKPHVVAYGPVSATICSTPPPIAEMVGGMIVDDPGSSSYQYNATTFTWQYNWKPPSTTVLGCYVIYVKSEANGQASGGFGVKLVK